MVAYRLRADYPNRISPVEAGVPPNERPYGAVDLNAHKTNNNKGDKQWKN